MLATSVLFGAAGCTAGPDYRRPALATPESLPAGSDADGIRITAGAPNHEWWGIFHDAEIDRLVARVRSANLDLAAASARVRAARAVTGIARASLVPNVGASGEVAYGSLSKNANPAARSAGQPTHLFQGTIDAGYEIDLWGRIARGVEAAEGDEAATEEDLRTIEIAVIADTVQAYFDLGAAESGVTIAREALDLRVKTREIVKVRFDSGIAPELEMRRADGELQSAAADLPEAERVRQVAVHRLSLLLGGTPDAQFNGRPPASFDLPPEIPVGIPSALLERRPDVRAAEDRLIAANARIGEAEADFFPRVTIAGHAGLASLHAATFASPAAVLWSLVPSIQLPIFSGGAIDARWREMQARTDEASADFRQTTLRAFTEVADSLSGIAGHLARRDRLVEEVTALARATDLASESYKSGLTTYLDVLDAQRALLASRRALLDAQRDVLDDIVRLEKALGCGWTDDLTAAIPAGSPAPAPESRPTEGGS